MGKRKQRPGLSPQEVREICASARDRLDAAATPPRDDHEAGQRVVRVLVVGADPVVRAAALGGLTAPAVSCDFVNDVSAARRAVAVNPYDVALIDLDTTGGEAFDLVREFDHHTGVTRAVVVSANATLETGIDALRSGAVDLLVKPLSATELRTRVLAAAEVADRMRRNDRRMQRLRRICRRLNSARQDVSRQLDVLCNDLVAAYQELADRMSDVSLTSEFSSLIRQELDVESLLRTTLEYLLTKTGPTNAAVFLPTGHSDYSLGAYVNYDIPKNAADVLLDHLADIVAPRFDREGDIVLIENTEQFDEWFDGEPQWVRGQHVAVFSCHYEDECLAVVMLFRDQKHPFDVEMLDKLELMRDLFAEQLGRVVSIHNRHRPKSDWPGFEVDPGGDDEVDDFGLAA